MISALQIKLNLNAMLLNMLAISNEPYCFVAKEQKRNGRRQKNNGHGEKVFFKTKYFSFEFSGPATRGLCFDWKMGKSLSP